MYDVYVCYVSVYGWYYVSVYTPMTSSMSLSMEFLCSLYCIMLMYIICMLMYTV